MPSQLENLSSDNNKRTGSQLVMGTIAENLTGRRTDAGISQAELAHASRVSQQLISQIERGVNLSTKHLPALARALRCSVSDLDESFFGAESGVDTPILLDTPAPPRPAAARPYGDF